MQAEKTKMRRMKSFLKWLTRIKKKKQKQKYFFIFLIKSKFSEKIKKSYYFTDIYHTTWHTKFQLDRYLFNWQSWALANLKVR